MVPLQTRSVAAGLAAAVLGLVAGCDWLFPRYEPDSFEVEPAALDIGAVEGDTEPLEETVWLTLDGTGPVTWTAVSDQPWLTAEPSSGSLGTWDSCEVTILADPEGLPAGIYTATVTFSVPDGPPDDVLLTVRLAVTSGLAGTSRLVYYASDIDDSLQPYGIYLPVGFVPGVGSPVAVYMHGYGGGASASFSSTKKSRADAAGMILVNVEGRGQHQFDGAAETDLFEVLADVDAAYTVDRSRVFLEGYSMGGTGAFRFIARHPDVFAAAGAVNGWTDYRLWHEQHYAPSPPDDWEYHPARIANLEYASPLTHAENVLQDRLFVRVYTGDAAAYVEGGRKLDARLGRLGTTVDFVEEGGGHVTTYNNNVGSIYDFFLSCQPLDLDPPSVRVRSNRLRTAKSFWFEVGRFAWNGWAEVTATRTVDAGTCTYDLATRNVRRFTIKTPPEGKTVTRYVVLADGVTCVDETAVSFPLTVGLSLDAAGSVVSGGIYVPPGSPVLEKTPEVEGPVMRAMTERFIVAYGSLDPAKTANNQMNAEELCKAWTDDWDGAIDTPGYYGFNSVILPVDEKDVSQADMDSAHLVIFGTEESSSLISDMATSAATPFNLPAEITIAEDQIVLDGQVFSTTDHGIWMVHPNPLAPGKFVVIGHNLVGSGSDGEWGEILWTRESWPWAWPDYVVFDTDAPMRDDVKGWPYPADQYVEWGFFDQDWAFVRASDPGTVVGVVTGSPSYGCGTPTMTVTVTVEGEGGSPVAGLTGAVFEARIDGEFRSAAFTETATPGVYEADVAISDLIVAGYDLTVEVIRPDGGQPVVGIGRTRFAIQ